METAQELINQIERETKNFDVEDLKLKFYPKIYKVRVKRLIFYRNGFYQIYKDRKGVIQKRKWKH